MAAGLWKPSRSLDIEQTIGVVVVVVVVVVNLLMVLFVWLVQF